MKRLWACLLLLGCGGAATLPPVPDEAVASPLSAVARSLEVAGLQRFGRAQGFLAPGERHVHRVEVPGGCHAVVSTTSRALRDLDLWVYSPEGDLLAEDVEPDDHPTTRWCGDSGHVYLVVRAYAGAGRYALTLWAGDEGSMDAVAVAVGGAPPVRYARPLATSSLGEALRNRGFGALRSERVFDLPAGDVPVRFPVELRPGRCIAVVVRAAVAVRLALELSSAIVDEAPGVDVAVSTCDDQGTAMAVVASPEATPVRAWVLEGPSAEVGGQRALWLGSRRPRRGEPPEVPRGWASEERGEAWWPAGRAQAFEGCGRLQVWVEQGAAEVEVRGEGVVRRGAHVVVDACGELSVSTDAPARIAWRWITRERR